MRGDTGFSCCSASTTDDDDYGDYVSSARGSPAYPYLLCEGADRKYAKVSVLTRTFAVKEDTRQKEGTTDIVGVE